MIVWRVGSATAVIAVGAAHVLKSHEGSGGQRHRSFFVGGTPRRRFPPSFFNPRHLSNERTARHGERFFSFVRLRHKAASIGRAFMKLILCSTPVLCRQSCPPAPSACESNCRTC